MRSRRRRQRRRVRTRCGYFTEARASPRRACARIRSDRSLCFLVEGDLLWSELFREGRGVVRGEIAEAKRAEFLSLSWEEQA